MAVSAWRPAEYTEQDLLARIQRESSPVKKAKYQIQLGRLKLEAAVQAYGHDDLEHGQPLLNAYLQQMQAAWDTLGKSGRQAIKKPQGFRELDIALREDGRLLNDLKHRTPYMDREPIEKVAAEIERLHEEVLQASSLRLRIRLPGTTGHGVEAGPRLIRRCRRDCRRSVRHDWGYAVRSLCPRCIHGLRLRRCPNPETRCSHRR